jgi:uncharacterized protein (TIGR01244 family)
MRKTIFIFILAILFLFNFAFSEEPEPFLEIAKIETPEPVKDKKDFFAAGVFYFAGQPDEDTFKWLASEGVSVVINLRTDEEMEKLKETLDEPALLKKLGMNYVHIPLGGKAKYYPEATDKLAQTLANHKGKALIHCRSAGRVSHLWIAYLVKYRDYTLDDAAAVGKKIKFSLPLEGLLGTPISLQIKKERPQGDLL